MAMIPRGDGFGNVVAQPQRAGMIPAGASGSGVAAAIGEFADTALRQMQAREQREAAELQVQSRAADKAVAMRTLHEGTARLTLEADNLAARIASGEVAKEAAESQWTDIVGRLRSEWTEKAPPAHREDVSSGLDVAGLQHLRTVRKGVSERNREDARAGLTAHLERMERLGATDREKAVEGIITGLRELGPAAGYGPDDIEKISWRSRENMAANEARFRINAARDNPAALDAALEHIRKDGDLSPQRAGELEQQVLARRATLEAKEQTRIAQEQAAADRRERQGESAARGLQLFLDNGGIPDDAYMQRLSRTVSGTSAAPLVTAMLQGAGETASFALLSPAQQERRLMELRQQAASNPQLEKRLQNFERIQARTREQLEKDPLMYGATRLKLEILPLQFTSLDDLAPQLAQRTEQAQLVAARAGVPVSPLLASEAARFTDLLAALPLAARKTALTDLARNMDPQAMAALSAQVGKKDDTLGLVMYATRHTPEGAELMLRGEDAMKAGRIRRDAGAVRDHEDIAKRIAEIPWATATARDRAVKAAQLTYDGLRDAKGSASIRDAITKSTGRLTEWNGSKVPMPPGMDEREFRRSLERLDPAALLRQAGGSQVQVAGKALALDKLVANISAVKLVPAGGPGEYALDSGGQLVMRADGVAPLRIKIGDR